MRAYQVLRKCLSDSLKPMHQTRLRVLMHAVEALVAGRRLTLMDIARSWPGAERVRAPLKAFDRLLSNPQKCWYGRGRWSELASGCNGSANYRRRS